MKQEEKIRCKHYNYWVIASGHYMWCYVCGALKGCSVVTGTNHIVAKGRWTKPTGDKDNNPFEYFNKKISSFTNRLNRK